MEEFEKRADRLELKRNFYGLGINLNQIIRYDIKLFRRKAWKI